MTQLQNQYTNTLPYKIETKDILKQGWLHKKSRHLKSWRKRLVVLYMYVDGTALLYTFKTMKYHKPTEIIAIKCICIYLPKSKQSEHLYKFRIQCKNSNSMFVFRTSSRREYIGWIKEINVAMKATCDAQMKSKKYLDRYSNCNYKKKITKALVVYGYIRQNYCNFLNIPTDIIIECIKMVALNDQWDKIYGTADISDDGRQIVGTRRCHSFGFGYYTVSRNEITIWNLKIMKTYSDYLICLATIGIVDITSVNKYTERITFECTQHGQVSRRDRLIKFRKNDRIQIELDLTPNKGTLKYIINDKDSVTIFDGIDINKQYVLGVELYKTDIIQLY